MLLAGVPLGGLFDSDWDVVVSFFCFFFPPPANCWEINTYARAHLSIITYPSYTISPYPQDCAFLTPTPPWIKVHHPATLLPAAHAMSRPLELDQASPYRFLSVR